MVWKRFTCHRKIWKSYAGLRVRVKEPAQADQQEQRDFIENYNKLQNYLPEDEAIYFAEASHPDHQVRPAHGWFYKDDRPAVSANSGRKRVNIHGALCLENFDAAVCRG